MHYFAYMKNLLIVRPDNLQIVVSDISARQVRLKVKRLTEVQFTEYAQDLIGKWVKWRGHVVNVGKADSGKYEVFLETDQDGDLSVILSVDHGVDVSGINKETVLVFQGRIESIENGDSWAELYLDFGTFPQ